MSLLATLYPESYTPPSGKLVEHRMDGSKVKDIMERTGLRIVHPKQKVIKPPKQDGNVEGLKSERAVLKALSKYLMTAAQIAPMVKMERDSVQTVLDRLVAKGSVEDAGQTLSNGRRSTRLWRVKR